MKEHNSKILAFEFLLSRLMKWHEEACPQKQNDLSILKSLKLLFFVSSANTNTSRYSLLLDDTFDSFVAMPYGHVESEVYSHIKENSGILDYYIIDNKNSTLKPGANLNELQEAIDPEVAKEIEAGIRTLKQLRSKLILMSAFELVDLSHAWYSWQIAFKNAAIKSLRSQPISAEIIKRESKVYSLNSF